MQVVVRGISLGAWAITAGSVVLFHCALDDRTPREAVASSQPAAGAPSTPAEQGLPTGSAGSGSDPAAAAAGSTGVAPVLPPASGGAPGEGGAPAGGAGAGGASGSMSTEGDPAPGNLDPVNLDGAGVPVVTSGSCPAFTACGGELDGTWLYAEACPTTNVGPLLSACPTGSVEYEAGGAAALSFGGGQVARTGAPVGDGVVTFPAECGLGACTLIAALVGGQGQCSEIDGDCACRTPFSVDWGQQAYAVAGNQLTLADGRTFEYCVEGDRLTYRESGEATEPGVFTLQGN